MATTESVCADVQPWVIFLTICASVCLVGVTVGLKLTVMSHVNEASAASETEEFYERLIDGQIKWLCTCKPPKQTRAHAGGQVRTCISCAEKPVGSLTYGGGSWCSGIYPQMSQQLQNISIREVYI